MTNGKRGPLFTILFAALMAGAGNGITIVAFPWLVLQRNGSALDASIVAMAGTIPLLVATLIAGAAVDYLGRKRVSMISDALSALSVAAVPVLALTFGVHVVNVAVLAGLAALGALFDPAGMTARETMLPEAATRAGWTLDHANSVYEAVFNLSYIVGPGVGGLMIATLGGVNTMWVTAGAFVLVDHRHRDAAPRGRGHAEPQCAARRASGPASSKGCASSGTTRCCARWRSSTSPRPASTCRWNQCSSRSTSPIATNRRSWAGC